MGSPCIRWPTRLVEACDPAGSRAIFLPFLYGSNEDGVEQAVLAGLSQADDTADLLPGGV